jgi:uncharacterized protein (DUF433 family)
MPDKPEDELQGPEIVGTRLTVYHLLDSFLDPGVTESEVCRVYQLSPEQVAAARAFVLRNPETVLAQHLKIEERLKAGNPPQVRESAERAKATFKSYREWLAERQAANHEEEEKGRPGRLPTFKEWLAEQEQR